MKIRLLIDTEDPERWGEDACIGSNDGRSTDHWVSARHPHEFTTIKEQLYDGYRKYCTENYQKFPSTVLIELPDEVMFQYMMDGLEDEDFLVYNVFTEKLVFSNQLNDACEEAYSTSKTNSAYLRGGMSSTDDEETDYILTWYQGRVRTAFDKENTIVREVKDEFYGLIYKEVKPYIQHWYNTKFLLCAEGLQGTVNERYEEVYNNKPVISTTKVHAEPCSSPNTNMNMNIKTDGLFFVFKQYCDDGEFYLGGKKYFSFYSTETFRILYLELHRRSTIKWDE